jgi:hypothetical protein
VLVLFDHGTPKGLARALSSAHTVHTAQSKGWDTLSNGALLDAAEEAGFELLLTTDRRIRYQQNPQVRRIAIVVLTGSTRWSRVNDLASRGWFRNWLATLFETFDVKLDRISNEGECFLSCFTSCDTARQIGHVRAK